MKLENAMMGKVPPQNIDAEEFVIGSCLVDTDIAIDIVSMITPVMFYKSANQYIFEAITNCLMETEYCDIVVVTDRLKTSHLLDSVGGPVYITKLSSSITYAGNAMNMALLIKEKYMLREYLRIGYELLERGYKEDIADVKEFVESEIYNVSDLTQRNDFSHLRVSIDEVLSEVHKIINKEISVIGVPSGFTKIDRLTSGWQNGDLIIVAARPSMGKTAFALAMAQKIATLKYEVGVFSLEMSKKQLAGRLISGESGYSNIELKSGRIADFDGLVKKSLPLAALPIFIDDTPALNLFELRSKARRMKTRHGIKIIIVDYLQLMTAEAGSREQEVSKISRGLKAIAKELDVPLIALSQLNREVEARADKRPRLSDLRDSGAIEQDADMVAFLYRPAKYEIRSIVIGDSNYDSEGLLLVDLQKNRNGPCDMIPLYHNSSLTRISEEREDEFTDEPVPFD
jgi:replicative DNA helicase